MTSQMAVQEYLQKHKIGPLFEDLMAKVISDMPDEPCLYLSRILHLRAEKKESKGLMRSGEFDSKRGSHDKPWQVNSKKVQLSDTKTVKKSATAGRPDFDHRVGLRKSTGFDEIWGDAKTTKKSHDTQQKTSTRGGASAWMDSQMDDGEDVMFSAYGYRGPRGKRYDDDPLMGELVVMDETPSRTSEGHTTRSGKKSGRLSKSSHHKSQLEQYVKSRQTAVDSGIEEEQDTQYDDALELLEDDMDLRREGVTNVKKSGVRMSSSLRHPPSQQASVKVSICARCATIMGGGQPSEPSREPVLANRTPMSTARSRKPPTELDPAPFNTVPSDEDEFESVSQVTGPRRPVWQDSDNEAVTPRKGKSMLASNLSPSKGLPMYSSSKPGKAASGPRQMMQSEDFSQPQRDRDQNPLHKTWSPMRVTEEVFGPREEDSGPEDGASAWQVPPDYDTDSSFYGSPAGKPQRLDRAY